MRKQINTTVSSHVIVTLQSYLVNVSIKTIFKQRNFIEIAGKTILNGALEYNGLVIGKISGQQHLRTSNGATNLKNPKKQLCLSSEMFFKTDAYYN